MLRYMHENRDIPLPCFPGWRASARGYSDYPKGNTYTMRKPEIVRFLTPLREDMEMITARFLLLDSISTKCFWLSE